MTSRPHGNRVMEPGTVFGRYQIVSVRGVGGMGTVYEALHTSLRKKVAIKVLNADLAWNEEARQRFLREGELAAQIQHHHVVDVHDVGTVDELPYLVMEYLDGEDLGALIAREGALGVSRTLDILLPIMAGLGAGHALGIIHRDLKPQNIFLARRPDGEIVPKALDFGVSKQLQESDIRLTRTGTVCGTVNYMSPEQARGAIDLSPASDQYSVGEILYECLTAQPAYPGDRVLDVLNRVATGVFTPPREVMPALDPQIETVILRAMAYDPAARFESLIALGRSLMPFASASARFVWSKTFAAAPVSARIPTTQPFGTPAAGLPAAAAAPPFVPGAGGTKVLPETPANGKGRTPEAATTLPDSNSPSSPLSDRYQAPAPPPPRSRRWAPVVYGLSGAVTLGLITMFWLSADDGIGAGSNAPPAVDRPVLSSSPPASPTPRNEPVAKPASSPPAPALPAVTAARPSTKSSPVSAGPLPPKRKPARAPAALSTKKPAPAAAKGKDVPRTGNRAPLVR